MPGVEPVGDYRVRREALQLPVDLDAVDATLGDQFFGGDREAFALTHTGFECEVEHEGPHGPVGVVVLQHVPFAVCGASCGLDGLLGLAGIEDPGFPRLVTGRHGGERGVGGDELFADGGVEDLLEADVVVVDGFAAAGLVELGAHAFDVAGGDFVESHAADLAADGVAVGSVGFEGAGFDVHGRLGEPSVDPYVEGGGVGEGCGSFALHFFEFGLEFLACGGFGGAAGFDEAAFAGLGVGCDFLAGVPDAVGVFPFAAGSLGAAVCRFLGVHGLQASFRVR